MTCCRLWTSVAPTMSAFRFVMVGGGTLCDQGCMRTVLSFVGCLCPPGWAAVGPGSPPVLPPTPPSSSAMVILRTSKDSQYASISPGRQWCFTECQGVFADTTASVSLWYLVFQQQNSQSVFFGSPWGETRYQEQEEKGRSLTCGYQATKGMGN